jgi:hypothetical protein
MHNDGLAVGSSGGEAKGDCDPQLERSGKRWGRTSQLYLYPFYFTSDSTSNTPLYLTNCTSRPRHYPHLRSSSRHYSCHHTAPYQPRWAGCSRFLPVRCQVRVKHTWIDMRCRCGLLPSQMSKLLWPENWTLRRRHLCLLYETNLGTQNFLFCTSPT